MHLVLKHKIVILLISGFSAIFLGSQFISLSFVEDVSTHSKEEITTEKDVPEGAVLDDEHEFMNVPSDQFVQHKDGTWHVFHHDRVDPNATHTAEYAAENNLPILLWWTPFTADQSVIKKCRVGSCLFTHDRSLQHHPQTKAFFFYGTDFKPDDLPLPRKESDEWALLHEESPKNKVILSHENTLILFNHTSTFRQESDYPITTQYLKSLDKLKEAPRHSFESKRNLSLAPIVYLQSGCNPPSDRDAYVNELMKHIEVDSFGKCLKNKELPKSIRDPLTMFKKELLDYVSQYKFAMAFENGICKDYVTEKLWRTLQVGVVPIYRGAPNIQDWLPSNSSVIMADDFASPAKLAEFVKSIANDPVKYDSYLAYKAAGVTNSHLNDAMESREWGMNDFSKMSSITGFECLVCDRIHENRQRLEAGEKPLRFVASKDHYGCPKPRKYAHLGDPPGTEDWEREVWTWEYDTAVQEAESLRIKVLGF